MLSAIIITLIVVTVLALALPSSGRTGSFLTYRPYNNRYTDATAAREDHLG